MATAANIERRVALEVRAIGPRRLEGHAALFNSPAQIGDFTETVLPGAFRSSLLSGRDILALADHDATKVLARTRAGTLKLAEDSRGLHFELDVPATTVGSDVLELVRSGNAGGCSFGFKVREERWQQRDRRELIAVELHEISIVSAWPAYEGTSVQARARMSDSTRLKLARLWLELQS
jgi:uncharacterized protein